jgi:xanthine dehydrogenase molybdopterin-binding subunit B
MILGMRHPFLGKYKVGFTAEGKLVSLESQVYSNGGYSMDLSLAVLERSLTHSDSCYYIPNVHLHGRICKTNLPTNTAFRGFGGPQGLMIAEQWITHVAEYLKKPLEEIRVCFYRRIGKLYIWFTSDRRLTFTKRDNQLISICLWSKCFSIGFGASFKRLLISSEL